MLAEIFRRALCWVASAAFVAVTAVPAAAEVFTFVALGDLPYRSQQAVAFERLIERTNAIRPAFTVHVGDFKSGTSRCDDETYESTLAAFNRFEHPLVYTPGDNEWTDCHRADAGGYGPLERLAKLRSMFFGQRRSLGRRTLDLERQSDGAEYRELVENARWERAGVVFATVHIVGSNNNLQRDAEAVNEYISRNAANLAWIAGAFRRAEERDAKALVLVFHADPNWEFEGREDHRSGFSETIRALKAHASRFAKPVLFIHGDKHRFVVDKPLYQNRRLIYNVTRMMVFGDSEVGGVLVTVDTDDPDVFSFRAVSVPQ